MHYAGKTQNLTKYEKKIKKGNEKAPGETQTLRAGCSKAEPKTSPTTDPLPGAQDGQNLISGGRSKPSPTDPVW